MHMFWSNFSRVCMFCNDNNSKLVPESTQLQGFPSWTIVNSLHKKVKSEDLIIEWKVHSYCCNMKIKFVSVLTPPPAIYHSVSHSPIVLSKHSSNSFSKLISLILSSSLSWTALEATCSNYSLSYLLSRFFSII